MSDFNFDAKTRIFSKKNAYGLGLASLLAYKEEGDAQPETESWGFNDFEFFDNQDTQAFIAGNNDMLLLAFRGTASIKDWMTDANFDLVGGGGRRKSP